MEKRMVWAAVAATVLVVSALSTYLAYEALRTDDWILRMPTMVTRILIEGDGDFNATNGVVAGSGTLSDPYVITIPETDWQNQTTIEIRNTTAPFVIQDSEFKYYYTAGCIAVSETAVRISNAVDFVITNTSVSVMEIEGSSGFAVTDCIVRGSTVVNCTDFEVADSRGGTFGMTNCTGASVTGNADWTLSIEACRDVVAADNLLGNGTITLNSCRWCRVESNECGGVTVGAGSADCSIVANLVHNPATGGRGILLDSAERIVVEGNLIRDCSHHGIELWEAVRNCTITGNDISNCYGAIVLRDAAGCEIFHNNILSGRSENPILDEQGWLNSWDAGYPEGGNYYFFHAGPDLYSGEGQDVPGPDGVCDVSVEVYTYLEGAPGVDRYPLMAPW